MHNSVLEETLKDSLLPSVGVKIEEEVGLRSDVGFPGDGSPN